MFGDFFRFCARWTFNFYDKWEDKIIMDFNEYLHNFIDLYNFEYKKESAFSRIHTLILLKLKLIRGKNSKKTQVGI